MKLISKCGKPKSLLDRKYPREGVKKVRVTEGSGFSVLEAISNLMVQLEGRLGIRLGIKTLVKCVILYAFLTLVISRFR